MRADIDARVMPHSKDAERSVLGAVMLRAEVLDDISDLAPAQFYRKAHQVIFEHMRGLARRGSGCDFVTLKDSLVSAGEIESVGGPSYLAGLVDGMPTRSNVTDHARIVREKAWLRNLIQTANQISSQAYDADADDDAKDVVEAAEQALFKISQNDQRGGFRRMSDVLPDALNQLEAWCKSDSGVSGIPSGLEDLDRMLSGFHPGQLITLAAKTGGGKTAFVLNVAQHVAKLGKSVGIFSLEMDEIELAIRTLSGEAAVNSQKMRGGYLGETDWFRISKAIETLSDTNLFIDDSPFITAFEMRARARQLKAKHGLDLLIVDYTQLMSSPEAGRQSNRTLELGVITRTMKGIAKELHIPVIALSQLNRKSADRSEKRPQLSDLRESGNIEQDSDVVLFIHREADYNETPENRGIAEIIIGKQRSGPVGTVTVGWIPEQTRFVNLDRNMAYADRLPSGAR